MKDALLPQAKTHPSEEAINQAIRRVFQTYGTDLTAYFTYIQSQLKAGAKGTVPGRQKPSDKQG